MARSSLLVVVLAVLAAAQAAKKLPEFIVACRQSDPEFDACVVRSLETLRPQLKSGVPELNVPSYDPLEVRGLQIDHEAGELKVRALFENLRVSGIHKFIVNNFKSNLDDLSVNISITMPDLHFSSDYKINGTIFGLPFAGKGAFNANLYRVRSDVAARAVVVKRRSNKYLQVVSLRANIDVADSKFSQSRDKDQELYSAAAIQFVHENRARVLQLAKPILEAAVDDVFKDIMNRVLLTLPADQLLLD